MSLWKAKIVDDGIVLDDPSKKVVTAHKTINGYRWSSIGGRFSRRDDFHTARDALKAAAKAMGLTVAE